MARPPPDAKEAFEAFYKAQRRGEVTRQGREFLEGRADFKARKATRWLWLIVVTTGVGSAVLITATALWLMHMAQHLGTTWGDTARQATSAYTAPDE